MTDYDVSVIVPTFNRANYIEECLDSLLAQTMPACEILVIDDGSEDDTAQRVACYGDRIQYVHKENGGKPSAVNLALSLIKGHWVWLFDDDDVALPDAIERRIEVLRSNPDAALVYSPHYLGSDGEDGRIVQGRLHQTPEYGADVFFIEILKGCFFHLATVLVRRECYERVGGFDPALFRGQDYDIQIRIARIVKPAFCPHPSFIFRQHSGSRGTKLIRHSEAQRDSVFRQYSQLIGRKIYSELPLGEYLVPRQFGSLSGDAYRQALLQRMRVMSNKACMVEFFDDLKEFLISLPDGRSMTAQESRQVADSMCTGYAYSACEQAWDDCMNMIRSLRSLPSGKAAIWALAKGVFRLAKGYPGSFSNRLLKLYRAIQIGLAALR
jgi:glycosyltransferase involved in cell wall biosynthesis